MQVGLSIDLLDSLIPPSPEWDVHQVLPIRGFFTMHRNYTTLTINWPCRVVSVL